MLFTLLLFTLQTPALAMCYRRRCSRQVRQGAWHGQIVVACKLARPAARGTGGSAAPMYDPANKMRAFDFKRVPAPLTRRVPAPLPLPQSRLWLQRQLRLR